MILYHLFRACACVPLVCCRGRTRSSVGNIFHGESNQGFGVNYLVTVWDDIMILD